LLSLFDVLNVFHDNMCLMITFQLTLKRKYVKMV